jgi:hypothetical protein
LVSDVDLGLILADPFLPLDVDELGAVAERVKAGGSVLHQRLSVFWGTPSTLRGEVAGGRFPSLDRADLLEHGRLLAGEDMRAALPAPDVTALVVEGAAFALDFLGPGWAASGSATGLGSLVPAGHEVVEDIRRPERLAAKGPRHLTKIVLFPVRFLYTAATGRVGTNQAAVDHYLAGDTPAKQLVAAAYEWRLAAPEDPDGATALLRRQLAPLYRHYLDDHIARLAALGEDDLAAAFERWRARLAG